MYETMRGTEYSEDMDPLTQVLIDRKGKHKTLYQAIIAEIVGASSTERDLKLAHCLAPQDEKMYGFSLNMGVFR